MTKQFTIEDIEQEIQRLQNSIKHCEERITGYRNSIRENKGMKRLYQIRINKFQNEITRTYNKINELKYQISVNGRKLKSAITVSKDLSNAGFIKAEWNPSHQVRGWGEWRGEFRVSNEPTKIIVDWTGRIDRYEQFYNYLTKKYGADVSQDDLKNITIMK